VVYGEEGERLIQDRFAWFFVFDKDSGKVIEIREYMNTALLGEVFSN
jgi:hypothetical protein